MPFSSMSDPSDLARAYAVMDAAWKEVEDSVPEAKREAERLRLAYLIASCAPSALDEDDLKRNVLLLYRARASQTMGVQVVR
ncbi:hypothetical protein ASE63_08010 [Bosea sp. Root381]|uniref:hypothetical protein n=1 Tax=Bosea sp. Root381 TaxID=1736524 RepID=UPI0007164036|nr:hypothetical protein [Bosea sp. Root381]KRE02294.1 hypothetical protein ASE63_08010 [Bosea sp. Root381]